VTGNCVIPRHPSACTPVILRAGVADGQLSECLDPTATAAEILAFQEGALILWRLDPGNTKRPGRGSPHWGSTARSVSSVGLRPRSMWE
jgi:hypothetical protein